MAASDDLLEQAAGIRAAPTAPSVSAMASDSLLDGIADEQKKRLDLTLDTVSKVNPDKAAEAKKLSSEFGLDIPTVQKNQDELSRMSRLREVRDAAAQSPFLARQLADPAFAAIAHDDTANASAIVQVLRNTGSAAVSGLRSASAGAVGLARAPFELAAPLLDPLTGTILPDNPLRRTAAGLAEYQQGIAGRAKAEMPQGDDVFSSGFYSGVASLSRNVAALPLAFLPGGQEAALGAMVAPVFGESYGQGRDKGMSPVASTVFGGSQAAIEYVTEKIPLGKLLGDLKEGTPFLKTLAHNMAREIPGEQAATVLQDLNEWAVLNPDKPFADYLKERPNAAAQTLIATMVGTGGQVTVAKGIESAVGFAERRAQKAQQAEQGAALLENLNTLAQASKVAQRDPESFQSFIAQATEDGPVQNVFVDGKFLMQSGMAPQLAELSPAVRDQLDRAIITGGDIAIPVDEYAARIATTDLAPQLLEHLKTEPDGFSRAEAATFMENHAAELEAEVGRILADKQGDDTFKASQEAVKAQILADMNQSGRFTEAKNEADAMAYSSYYAARAAQLGVMPEELYQQRRVKFVAQGMEGQRFDQLEPEFAAKVAEKAPDILGHFKAARGLKIGKSAKVWRGMSETSGTHSATYGKGLYTTLDKKQAQEFAGKTGKVVEMTTAELPQNPLRFDSINDYQVWEQDAREALGFGRASEFNNNVKDIADFVRALDASIDGIQIGKGKDAFFVKYPAGGQVRSDSGVSPGGDAGGNDADGGRSAQVKGASEGFDPNDPNILKQSAFHGSPYKFDKFSLEHMGKGEGAQAYGWGLYFAGNKQVAEYYRSALTRRDEVESWSRKDGEAIGTPTDVVHEVSYDLTWDFPNENLSASEAAPFVDKAMALARDGKSKDEAMAVAGDDAKFSKAVELLYDGYDVAYTPPPDGQLYEVNIPEDDTFLLWDKPLSEQPEKVRAALKKFASEFAGVYQTVEESMQPFELEATTGEGLYRAFVRDSGSPEGASRDLNSLGISGIKYLDGSSRDMSGTKWKDGADPSQYDRLAKGVAENYLKDRGDVPDAIRRLKADAVASGAKQYADAAKALESGDLVHDLNYNYVIFDDEAVQILQTYYQPDGGTTNGTTNRGAFSPDSLTVALLKGADLSTALHEAGHFFFENDIFLASELVEQANAFGYDALKPGERQILADVSALMSWHGIQGGIEEQLRTWHTMDFEEKRSHHERTAESFEKYLFEGNAPSIELAPYFQKFRAWMLSVYRSITDFLKRNPEAGKLSDEVRSVFDRMLATNEQIQLAEQGRSMMPLFESPEQSGMTPEEFAAYHAQGVDATNDAIQDLQAKGLRDMQWRHNARGRAVKRLQKESKARRAEVMMEARREVMSTPLYRAWDFLTRKLTAEDKAKPAAKSDPETVDPQTDSLFTAIAKLGGIPKDFAVKEWGIDPKSKPQSGVFGKPVWRITEGEPADLMAEQLARLGYLEADADGKLDLAEFYDRFAREMGGEAQYSSFYDYEGAESEISNPGGLNAGRLNLNELAAMGMPDEVINALKARRMTASDGMSPDLVAELFEFSSGDEMVRALAAAETPKDAINALTDQRMLEAYGELATPEAIEREADKAIHNEARARMVATELNALAKAAGKPKVMAPAAKEFAAAMIARLKVRDIRPGQYANAEVRAAKAAEKAVKAGDHATAFAEKRNQTVNVYATRAAYDAQDEVDSGLRYFKRFDKRSKTLDPEYQDQIEAMLERFDLRPASLKALDRRASFAEWLAAQREAGIEPDVPEGLENEANRTHYKNLTVEEFRGLVDTVKQIEHLGRLKNKLLTAQDQREFAAIVDEVSASIVDNGGTERPVELEEPGRFKQFIENFRAGHRKLASLVRQMDGGKDAGPFWRVFVRGMNEAGTREASMVEDATVRLMEIYKPMLALKGGLNGDKRFIREINASLTRAGRLSVALNWGNETNRLRVMEGDGWTEYQVQAILNTMTRAEWQFVQDTWAFIDSYWPQIEAKEKRVTGRAPDKVKALPFTMMVGGENVSLSGGYYPIKYDSNRDDKAEKHEAAEIAEEMKRGAYTRASTRRGHTKARTESVKRPIRKTLDVITQHVGEVTHDLAWHEWLIDANRLLDAKPINQAIRSHYGTAVIRTMKDALTGIAAGDMGRQTALDTALLYLRANVSRSTMGFSLTTAFLQPFGLLQSVVRIGAKPVIHGIGRWAGDVARMESTLKWVGDKSEFMRLRAKTFNRELNEIRNRVSHGHSKIRTVYDASLFMLMQKMQMVADIPTWAGAYDKAMGEGVEESEAVAMADQAVLDAQGGGQNKDMAEIQRKHPMLTMFYSYFNTTLNLAAESTAQTNFKNPLAVAGWVSDMMLLMVVPALGPAMILAMMRGEACWEEGDCAREMAQAQLGYTLGTVVGVREMSGMAEGYDYAGPPVGRVVADLGKFSTQVSQGEVDEAAVMSAVRLFGTALGVPTTQIVRSWRGWNAWAEGEAPLTSILMGPPPKD